MPNDEDTPDPATADVPMLGFDAEEEWNRPRGLYTGTDRQFLWGVKEYDSSVARSNRRLEIRNRTVNSLRDLFYLTLIEDDQQQRVFEQLDENTDAGELRDAVASLVTFLYVGLDDSERWLEETITDGVSNAVHAERDRETYGFPDVQVDINVERGFNLDELEERLHGRAHTLTPEEIGVLVRSGRVSADELDDLDDNRNDNPTMGDAGPR
jgi:hypothetical protein